MEQGTGFCSTATHIGGGGTKTRPLFHASSQPALELRGDATRMRSPFPVISNPVFDAIE